MNTGQMEDAKTISASHFQRNTILDGWRGIAIIFVLLGHFAQIPFIELGTFGVQLFFVLSGRLMAEVLFVRKEAILKFYWRRITRIMPILYVYLLILAALLFANPFYPVFPFFDATPKSLLASATFSYNYLLHSGYGSALCDHIWSLCVEEHSYMVLGLLAILSRIFKIKTFPICIILALMCMLNGAWLTLHDNLDFYHVFWRTDTMASGILLGCGLYALHHSNPGYFRHITPLATLLLIVVGVLLNTNPIHNTIKFSFGTIALALAIATLDQVNPFIRSVLSNRVLCFFGRASFSIYIFQQPFANNLGNHRYLALATAIGVGVFFFYSFEQPIRRLLNGRFQPRQLNVAFA
jgi:peptidoglycan/LPS O-acetylase OafA/YrhL